MKKNERRLISAVVRRAILWSMLCTAPCVYSQVMQFNVPAQDAATAIPEFARQAGLQIIAPADQLKGLRSHPIKGSMDTHEALRQLLEGTGLVVASDDGHTISLRRPAEKAPSRIGEVGTSAGSAGVPAQSVVELEEVVVTAQKKAERLQEVPVPIAVLDTEALTQNNQARLQDYYASVPGLNVATSGSFQYVTIRGITTGPGNPTVGITVDDMPFGASSSTGGGQVVPDIDPGDLARVEVLRGPQGTLYGASSMGGLIKFVTVDPSTDAIAARFEAGTSSVHNGDKLEYNIRGSFNLPLGDTVAVRASAFTREDPGYIDNPVAHVDGVNGERTSGSRLSGLWRPSEAVSLKLSAIYQQTSGSGAADVSATPGTTGPLLGDLQQDFPLGTGGYTRKIQAYTSVLTAKLGLVDLTSVTGYNVNEFSESDDFPQYSSVTQQLFNVPGSALVSHNKTDKFTQEIRLSVPVGQHFDWLLGGFYTHEASPYVQEVRALNSSGAAVGSLVTLSFPTTYREYAAFTDLTFHLTDRFDVQLGARESQIRQSYVQTYAPGPLLPNGLAGPDLSSSNNAFTYLLTPRYRLSADLMVYARLASGYRAGGPNTTPGPGIPPEYGPDRTLNYEIGTKSDFMGHKLSLDASVYYIDWKDIQLNVKDPVSGIYYYINGSRAKSQGLELSAAARPLQGFTINAWVVFSDAVLTQGFPPASTAAGVYGADGDRLPFTGRFSGHLSLEEDFPLVGNLTGYLGGEVSYVGSRENTFTATSARQIFPAYARTDLRTGVKHDSWTISFFANNVADRRGVLETDLNTGGIYYIQPRTAGLTVTKTF